MTMNRRNVLMGLGAAAAGSSAVFGSGAFTSLEADRDASFSVQNDGNAYLTLAGDGTYVSETVEGTNGSGSANIIEVTADKLNDNAETILGTLTITNNTADSSNKWVYIDSTDTNLNGTIVDFAADETQDTTGDGTNNITAGDSLIGSNSNIEIAPSHSVTLEIVIDTREGDPSTVTGFSVYGYANDQSA